MRIIRLKHAALLLLYLLIPLLFQTQIFGQNVHSRVNSDSLTIGEVFDYSIILQQDKEYQKVVFPDTSSFPSSIELIERHQFKLSEYTDSLVYRLQFFSDQDIALPQLPVHLYTQDDSITVYTEPALLMFKSVVAAQDTTFKPLKPNFAFPRPWWPWLLGIVLLVAFLYWWFYVREEPEQEETAKKPEIAPFHNPLKELEKNLHDIKQQSNIAETKDYKLFYSQIGDAIRTYFEELYRIPALESTSTELLRYLDAYGVDDILVDKTRVILRRADLVKFAKFTPTLDDAWNTYKEAIAFLEQAKSTDSARIARLKAQYREQLELQSAQEVMEDS